MRIFDLETEDISKLTDADLRELVGRLSEAELSQQNIQPSCVLWGGAQEAADGGLDVHVKDVGQLINPSFVSRSNTGFQVKKNSMAKAACRKEIHACGQPFSGEFDSAKYSMLCSVRRRVEEIMTNKALCHCTRSLLYGMA